MFPRVLPEVYDVGKVLPIDFHINSDGSLCLGTEIEIRKRLVSKNKLKDWFEYCVKPFIFSSFYFKKYEVAIFGEEEHGTVGELDSLKRALGLHSSKETCDFLKTLFSRRYRRKIYKKNSKINKYDCPCGSGKKFKECHRIKLEELDNIFEGKFMNYLQNLFVNYSREKK